MANSSAQFNFFDEVIIDALEIPLATLNGRVATVLGIVLDDQKRWYYTVSVEPDRECWCAFEHELRPTGRVRNKTEFYDGQRVRVIVDESGEGKML